MQKKIEFFKQTILHLKLLNSFHRLNRFAKTWVFQAGYLSFKILKLINSIHGLNQFAKKLRFLNRLFQLWRFCFFFPSCFFDEIGSRLFSCKVRELKKLRKSNFLKFWIAKNFLKKATQARKIRTIWIYLLDSNVSLNSQFLSRVFDLWKFQVFHFIF